MGLLFEYVPPGKASKSEVQDILEPHREELSTCVLRGFADYFTWVAPDGRARAKSCTMSMCVNNFVEERVKETFATASDIKACNSNCFFKLYVGDRIVVRFKKLTDEYLVMPPDTDQGKDWFCNRAIDGIPDDRTRVTIGWRVRPLGEEIIDIAATFQASTKVLGWQFSILNEADIRTVYAEYADDVSEHFPISLKLKADSETRKSS